MKIYAERMLELRKEKGYTQMFVSSYLKIDQSNYSKYELGKLEPNIDILCGLADLYGVSVDYILGRSEY